MHKRGTSRWPVSFCPSVCPSHSWTVSKRQKIASAFFLDRVLLSFYFLKPNRCNPNPRGNPLCGQMNNSSMWKSHKFSTSISTSWKRYEIGPCLLCIVSRKSWIADRSVSVQLWWPRVTLQGGTAGFAADLLGALARTVMNCNSFICSEWQARYNLRIFLDSIKEGVWGRKSPSEVQRWSP